MARRSPTVQEWTEEIDEGLRFRQLHGLEDSWADLEALYYNVHDSSVVDAPNIIMATGDAMLSSLTVPNPHFQVKARRPNGLLTARTIESVDNMLKKDMKLRLEVEAAALSAYLYGVGFLKVGYDSEFGFDPAYDLGGTEDPHGMTLTQFDKKGRRIEFGPTDPGMPWVKSVLPHDIVVPWGTRTLDDAPWVVHRVVRHIDDIKADPKYENKRDLRPVLSMEDFTRSYQTVQKPYRVGEMLTRGQATRRAEYVELWEIHDRRTEEVIVIATGHLKFLRKEPDALQLDGLPFVEVKFVPNPRALWTTPDAYYLKQAQAELADISIQQTKQRRLSALKFLYNEDAIDPEEVAKATGPDVGAGVRVNGSHDPRTAITTLQAGNNIQLYQESEVTRRNAREMVGFSRNQFGEFEQSGRRTASEAMIVQESANKRMSRRQLVISDAYTGVIKKVNALIFEYWRLPKLTEIVSEDGSAMWVRYIGSDLKGEYEYDVTFSSEPEPSLQERKNNALNLYVALSQDPTVDQVQLRRYLMDAFNEPDFSRLFQGQNNANLQLPMQGMQQGGGGVQPNGGAGQLPAMPGV